MKCFVEWVVKWLRQAAHFHFNPIEVSGVEFESNRCLCFFDSKPVIQRPFPSLAIFFLPSFSFLMLKWCLCGLIRPLWPITSWSIEFIDGTAGWNTNSLSAGRCCNKNQTKQQQKKQQQQRKMRQQRRHFPPLFIFFQFIHFPSVTSPSPPFHPLPHFGTSNRTDTNWRSEAKKERKKEKK